MKISYIIWETVTVECEDDASHNEQFHNATITFNPDIRSLQIIEEYRGHHQRSSLYAEAKFEQLDSEKVVFSAHWWSSIGNYNVEMVPVLITGRF